MIEAEWWEYDSLDELADAVAGDVAFIVESAVDARGDSLIAVPGGRTGPEIFPKLAAQKQQWRRVTIIPTDDRLRFRPALNRSGQAVAGWFGYAQRAPR